MKVLLLGASKNIGYFAGQRLLAEGATVTFLLRNPSVFDNDESIKPYIASQKARIVQGNALNEAEVREAWRIAADGDGPNAVDACLFTIGGTGSMSLLKGVVINPPDLCARSMMNVLSTMPRTTPSPKIIAVSTIGLGGKSAYPAMQKPIYSYVLAQVAKDKVGMESALAHCAGWTWERAEPEEKILPQGWRRRLPEAGSVQDILVVRGAIFKDGPCKGDESADAYRVSDTELSGAYSINRRDVAHFIVEKALKDWDNWKGKCARVAY